MKFSSTFYFSFFNQSFKQFLVVLSDHNLYTNNCTYKQERELVMQNSTKKKKAPTSFSERIEAQRQDFGELIERHYTLCHMMPSDIYAISIYLDLQKLKTERRKLLKKGNDSEAVEETIDEIEKGALKDYLSNQTKWANLVNLANLYSTLIQMEEDLRLHPAVKSVKPPNGVTSPAEENAWYAGKVDTIIRRNWMLSNMPRKRSYREEMARTFRWTEY